MSLKLGLIVTAAGLSSRHPPNKLLLNLDGEAVIRKTVRSLLPFPGQIIVVTGHESQAILDALKDLPTDKLSCVHNPDYPTGLASSVKIGVKAITHPVDYFCFSPGDKPFIHFEVVRAMINHLEQTRPLILQPRYLKKPGHPTFFHSRLLPDLLALEGDEGGRQLIARLERQVLTMEVNEPGISMDMDHYLEDAGGHA
jgi:molybdenum cofactor cytidylyltransferase